MFMPAESQVRATWSLRGKMLRSLGVTSTIVLLALSAAGAWFVRGAANREVDALLHEELDEVRATFALVDPSIEAFEELATELHESHPETSFAWRIWLPGGQDLLGEYGDLETLLQDAPARLPLNESFKTEEGYRWRSTKLRSGHIVGLIIDEEPHFDLVRQFAIVALLTLFFGVAGIAFMGVSFTSRVSHLLARVAKEARQVSGPADEDQITHTGLPEELFDVVEALKEMLRNIRQEQRDSRVLIAGVAHELRAPLQNLIGEAEVTLLAERTPEAYRGVLHSQLEELRDLGDAIQNLVALCSAKRSAAAEELESFDFFEELRIRLVREQGRAEREGVAISIETNGRGDLVGDREALMVGLRNVVSNAIDWTPAGGKVEVHCQGGGGMIAVDVQDSGPGIPAELAERLFEPFVRGAAAGGRRIGYGLGLALARSAITAQGGTIEVLDSAQPGAHFHIKLPRKRSAKPDPMA